MYTSQVKEVGSVSFPAFRGERHHMRGFTKKEGLPKDLKHWQGTVDQMLEKVDTDNTIFIMIDQGIVRGGTSHRRPGPHIDGYWNDGISAHGGVPSHGPSPSHGPTPGRHMSASHGSHIGGGSWDKATLTGKEAILLASDVVGCRGWTGSYKGVLGEGGDCSAIDLSGLEVLELQSHKTYMGNVGFIHESIPLGYNTQRTLVRLNIKDWEPQWVH